MATQLKPTDFRPIPYRQSKPNVRVAFIAGEATVAVHNHMAEKPAQVRESTLDELAGQPVSFPSWTRAYATWERAFATADASDDQGDIEQFCAVWGAHSDALFALMTTPAPTLAELEVKTSLLVKHRVDELTGAVEVFQAIAADTTRLIGKSAPTNSEWAAAISTYEAVGRELNVKGLSDEAVDALTNRETAAAEALFALPCRTIADLAVQIRVGVSTGLFFDMERMTSVLENAERLALAPPRENGAIVQAFQTCRDAFSELRMSPEDLPDSAADAFYARIDRADMVLKTEPALTTAGVAMKLKRVFSGINVDRWSDEALFDGRWPAFAEGLKRADLYEQMLWSTIEDLDRISGNAEAAPPAQCDPHRDWLQQRNDLIAYLNAGDEGPATEEEISIGIGQLNALDKRILGTPATTSDGSLAQMVLVAQLSVEGHEVDEVTTATLLTQAKEVVSLGSLAGASCAIQEQFA